MTKYHRQLSDQDFLRQFEEASLNAELLSHEAHFRIAWIYLNDYSFENALDKVTEGIQRFDNKYAGGQKYHATITYAYMLLIHQRMNIKKHATWNSFIENNMDLLKPVKDVLLDYYKPETLFSQKARQTFLEPDKRKLTD